MSSFTLSPNDEAQRNTATVITSGGIAVRIHRCAEIYSIARIYCTTRGHAAARKCVNLARARGSFSPCADDTAVIVNNYARFPGLIERA